MLGVGAIGACVAFAPAVSAAPSEPPVDPRVARELASILIESLQTTDANVALQDLAAPGGQLTRCLIDTAVSSPAPVADADALTTLTPCLNVVGEVDPTALPRLVSSLNIRKMVATLADARQSNDPAVSRVPQARPSRPTPSVADPDTGADDPLEYAVPDSDEGPYVSPSARTTSGSGRYFAPTSGTLTSPFGDGRNHQGIDIANSIGTPIVSVTDGKVISAGPAEGFGLWVRIQHADGTITTYGHNNVNVVTVGQRVSAGQKIATVGNRGDSSGPHLHFEVKTPGGQNVDPLEWLADRGIEIADDESTPDVDRSGRTLVAHDPG
ncbi:M23 family metallopeptidase [Antrihabitans sp. YC2-6]|nr:M23 family metallopeptidase [Antrihabitans sp. YC2-6]